MTESQKPAAAPDIADVRIADLLIEIGCEELPPKALDGLREALFSAVCAGLEREQLVFDQVASRAYSSPRRLALLLSKVPARLADQHQDRRGPALTAAFDANGKPTGAALGFARSLGLEMDQLQTVETDKGRWLAARVHVPGKALGEIVFPVLEQAIRQLPVPRPMRWASHEFSFIRPVHWLVVLHGSEVLQGQLLGHQAGNTTVGHRIHSPGPHLIPQAAQYLEILRKAHVLADQEVRSATVRRALLARNAATRIDEPLLAEVNNLVEWPVVIECSFDASFLEVPHAALVASMQDHQKLFPVLVAAGKPEVSNHFMAVANLQSADERLVREGFERVIRPRLADARFFLEQDQKLALDARIPLLNEVIFQQKIGSIGDKSRRIAWLSKKLAEKMGIAAAPCERAALLAKCDLMTQMVGEFPELQGTMGRHYALHSGESAEVANAIEQHYWPRYAGDFIPEQGTGQVVGLADRTDTLVAIFAAGLKPTGNKDPFALRRIALGLVRILCEAGHALPLDRLLALAANSLAEQGHKVAPALLNEVREFINERAKSWFRDAGHGAEVIQAAMSSEWDTLPDLQARLEALSAFLGHETGLSLAAANKRIGNILRKSDLEVGDTIDEDLLKSSEERNLFKELQGIESTLSPLLEAGDYTACLERLSSLRPSVDRFFDAVMVMDEDPALRRNRLTLLSRLKGLFDRIADLSVLG